MKRETRDLAFRLVAELVVVFVGVYLAFVLNNHGIHRQQEAKRQQLYQAFLEELATISEVGHTIDTIFVDMTETLAMEIEAGKMPNLHPLNFTFGFRADMWNAAIQGGNIDILDIRIVSEMSELYGRSNFIERQSEKFDAYTREILIPNLGKESCYDRKTKKLREKYQWYPLTLQLISHQIGEITEAADRLIAKIEEKLE
jgi:hypothetical protein